MDVENLFNSVLGTGAECVVPVVPGFGNLEKLIHEASRLQLRLAGVPSRCITVLPPLPCDESTLLAYCRAYCFCSRLAVGQASVREQFYQAFSPEPGLHFHPADYLGRIVHLCSGLMEVAHSEFQAATQTIALLQLSEVARVCQQIRLDFAGGYEPEGKVRSLLLSCVKPFSSQTCEVRTENGVQDLHEPADIDSDEASVDGTEEVDDGNEQSKTRFLSACDFTVVNESGIFYEDGNESGNVAAIFLKRAVSIEACSKAAEVFEHAATTQNMRKALNGGVPPNTGIVGYYDYLNNATTRKCRETQFTRKNWPAVANDVAPLLQALDDCYHEHAAAHYRQQRLAIPQSYQLFGTAFSTITVNKNFRTGAHTDRGDFKSGLGVVAVIDGDFEGCHLAIPNIGKAFNLKAGDVLLFNTALEHGNTEIASCDGMWRRVSIVCYFRTGLISQTCVEEEMHRLGHMTHLLSHDSSGSARCVNVNEHDSRKAPLLVPPKLIGQLSQTQLCALSFANDRLSQETGCVIAMTMGLGKTLLALTLVYSHHVNTPCDDVLIVTPKTVVPHWQEECEKWKGLGDLVLNRVVTAEMAPVEFETMILRYNQQCDATGGASKVGHCFILNPEVVASFIRRCPKFNPTLIILDEGHRVSSKQSRLKETLALLGSRRRIVLSGTPVQNSTEELYRLVEWVCPEIPLTLRRETFSTLAASIDAFINGDDSAMTAATAAQRFIVDWQKGFVFRFADQTLPKLEELLIVCGSSSWQKYQRHIHGLEGSATALRACEHRTHHLSAHPLCLIGLIAGVWARSSDEETIAAQSVDDSEMRRLSALELLLSESTPRDSVDGLVRLSGKMSSLIRIVEYCRRLGEKVVVFSQYVAIQEVALRFLQASGLNPLWIRGKDALDVRKKSMKRFASLPAELAPVLIVSTKVGAFGVDLTAANNVVLIDSWWNPQVDAQAIARCYRRNQTRPVTVFRLATLVDDATIIRAQQRKLALFQTVIDGNLSRPQEATVFGSIVVRDTDPKRKELLWDPLIQVQLEADADLDSACAESAVCMVLPASIPVKQ